MRLARALLRLYPRPFREETRAAYLEAVEHRLRRERGRGGSLPTLRVWGVLLGDTIRAAPAEWHRRARWSRLWSSWLGDVRLAARGIVRRPGTAALVVLTLGLGIGLNAAVFRILDGTVLHPYPFEGGDRIVGLGLHSSRGFTGSPPQELLERWREGSRTLDAIEVYRPRTTTVTGAGRPEVLSVTDVSSGIPRLAGVSPVLGRAFGTSDFDPDAPPVVMMSEDWWRSAFGADPGIVGRALTLDGTSHTVVGVWPRDTPIGTGKVPELWRPIPRGAEANRAMMTHVLGRMRPGAARDQVQDELQGLAAGVEELEASRWEWRAVVRAPSRAYGDLFVRGVWVAYGAALMLLIVAVVNAASLLLHQAVEREGELGVRLALGGSAFRLVRLFVTEGLVVVLLGSLVAVGAARWGGRAIAALAPERFPDLPWDFLGGALPWYGAFLIATSVLACGLIPALHLRSPRIRALLLSRGVQRRGQGSRLLRGLLAAQVTMATVLVVGSGLALRSHRALASVSPGFAVEEILVFSVSLRNAGYEDEADHDAFFRRATEEVSALPGVRHVVTSGVPPFRFSITLGEPRLEGEPEVETKAFTSTTAARQGYFGVMGIPILEGRPFGRGAPEASIIVNETFARRHGPAPVVGRRLFMSGDSVGRTIVGVAGDVRAHSLADDTERVQVYYPESGPYGDYERFIVRAAGDPADLVPAVREVIARLDPDLPLRELATGRQLLADETADERFLALLLAMFGGLALVLAVAGVYGAVSLAVSRRRREVGIRMALGAGRGRVLAEVSRTGLVPVVLGMSVGLVAAWVGSHWIESLLYEVEPTDPASFAGAAALLLAVAATACVIPARRASRVHPVESLRAE